MAWDKYTKEVPLKPNVQPFLQKCKEAGILLGIATSNSRELVENIISVHGLEHYFSSIKTGCDVKRGKPAPDIYLKACKELGEVPENCIAVEDSKNGILSAHNANMSVIMIPDLWQGETEIDKLLFAKLKSLGEIKSVL